MNNSKIYVGSLSYDVTPDDLKSFFGEYGEIGDVKLIIDRETNRSKGFAFITFVDQQCAKEALNADGKEMQGRKIRVNMAREDDDRRSSGARGGGGRRGGAGGSGGGRSGHRNGGGGGGGNRW